MEVEVGAVARIVASDDALPETRLETGRNTRIPAELRHSIYAKTWGKIAATIEISPSFEPLLHGETGAGEGARAATASLQKTTVVYHRPLVIPQ